MTDRPSTASTPSPPDCDAWMGKTYVCTEPKDHDGEHLSLGMTIAQHEARHEHLRYLEARQREHNEEPGHDGADRSWWRCMPVTDVGLWWRVYVDPGVRADSPSPEGAEPPDLDEVKRQNVAEFLSRQAMKRDHPERLILADALGDLMQYEHPDKYAAAFGLLSRLAAQGVVVIEREAALPEPSLDALLLAAEEVDNSWYDDEGTVRWHPELWERLVALRRAHNAYEEVELARLRGTEGSPDKCPVEGCDELPEDHRHIGPIEELLEKARLVSQWHGAMNSGPLEVLDAELGELGEVVARVKANG